MPAWPCDCLSVVDNARVDGDWFSVERRGARFEVRDVDSVVVAFETPLAGVDGGRFTGRGCHRDRRSDERETSRRDAGRVEALVRSGPRGQHVDSRKELAVVDTARGATVEQR